MWRSWEAQKDELRSFLHRRLADAPATEDVLHEVFLKAALQGGQFCQIEHPRAWFFQVARNVVADRHRRGRVFEPVPDDLPALSQETSPVEALAQCLPQALATLAQEDRDALEHCEIAG
ncbi:sigma factor [Acidocella sp. MX-AZ03]